MNKIRGEIISISGPLVVAGGVSGVKLYDIVEVGDEKLLGEVIEIREDKAWIQVYEDTTGLSTSEPVASKNIPLSVELGPGLIGRFYDGIQRPLSLIYDKSGSFIKRGLEVESLEKKKKWEFIPKVKKGDKVNSGDILGEVQETSLINHKILTPINVEGTVQSISKGMFSVDEKIIKVKTEDGIVELSMSAKWPIRKQRPFSEKVKSSEILITGQRVIDTFFPMAKGGAATIPGPFGSGKTVVQQQLAKWADAEIIVYIGCGERGNEMTEVLEEFSHLKDPKSGEPLMDRTILIANTSNMPIAAREASIYTGMTIAEYYRDMGYDVALMADSTSRWAEALREISSRLEEMPGEEGYPAYLASRIAEFYERAGKVKTLGKRGGSVSVVGAVSPPGGDLSEPVTQSTLSFTKVFWALDGSLARARHYPAIHWLNSYSLYSEAVEAYVVKNINSDYARLRKRALEILQKESELEEIIRIVGTDSLSKQDRMLLMVARSIREDFLQQNAYDEADTYTPLSIQVMILKVILQYYKESIDLLEKNKDIEIESLIDNRFVDLLSEIKLMNKKELEKAIKKLGNLKVYLESVAAPEDKEKEEKAGLIELLSHRKEVVSEEE